MSKPVKKMFVIKRDGRKEDVYFDKITSRIQKLCYGLNMDFVDPAAITLKVVSGLYAGVTTVELDSLAAETAATQMMDYPDYAILAARIEISNLHKQTKKHFSDVIELLHNNFNSKADKPLPLVSEEIYNIVMKNASRLNSCIIYDRDFSFNYFAFKKLEQFYLQKIDGKPVERPQHMFMRVGVQIHKDDIESAIETYNLLSERFYIHSRQTLIAACFPSPQLSSSFAMMMPSDSIESIFQCVANCGQISKYGGGIGVSMQNIRAKGAYIAGTNGTSNGVVPMLRVFDGLAALPYQLSTKKPAEITIYIEPWHADIFEFLILKKPTGKEELRARHLNYALWVPDLFMKRVENNQMWSLMCPDACPGLIDVYGEDFEKLYESYEEKRKFVRQVQAQDLWKAIVLSQIESEMPFMMYKDSSNSKSNQKHLGTLRNSNHTANALAIVRPDEIVACNEASISVDMFVSPDRNYFDFEKLKSVVKVVIKNLDKIIDVNYYALPEVKKSCLKHRPVSLGVQGLADVFILLKIPFDSKEAEKLNKQIFETVYYGALESSCELAEKYGTYETYENSPVSQGVLQYDLWKIQPTDLWNWEKLKLKIAKHGVRNSVLTSQMPTEDLSEILCNNNSVEPYKSFVATKRVGSTTIQLINHHLLRDLTEKNLWNEEMKSKIITSSSLRNIPEIPDDMKEIYKTVWEIKQKVVINMAKDRGPFLDQSQSIDIHMEKPTYSSMCAMHFYGWKCGLKTGACYLKTKSKSIEISDDNRVAVKKEVVLNGELDEVKRKQQKDEEKNLASMVCSLNNPGSCEMCGA